MKHRVKTENAQRKERFDVVNYILESCIMAYPVSSFIISLYKQYGVRGSLSKKQLQGLYGKASEIRDLDPAKLATLQALINKMPTRYKSELPGPDQKISNTTELQLVEKILESFPSHKGALMLHSKLKGGGVLSPREASDLSKFSALIN